MSDHEPPASKRGSSEGYDPFAWAQHVTDTLAPSSSSAAPDDEAKRDYRLFQENERVRKSTAAEIMRLCKEGKFSIISEFRARRWELREWIDEIERSYWQQKDKESEEWR